MDVQEKSLQEVLQDKIDEIKQRIDVNKVKLNVSIDSKNWQSNLSQYLYESFTKTKAQALRISFSSKVKVVFDDSMNLITTFFSELKNQMINEKKKGNK